MLSTEGETCRVELQNGPVMFRSTVVKPYYEETKETEQSKEDHEDNDQELEQPIQRNPERRR